MKRYSLTTFILSAVSLAVTSCGGGSGPSTTPTHTPPPPVPFVPTSQFGVYNNCPYTIWAQTTNQPSSDKAVIQINSKTGYSYNVNGQSLPSFTLIPKAGCDSTGNNCTIGQSLANTNGTCPNGGCQPAIDSRFEASFNDPGTEQFFDVSAVDGFTLPYSVQIVKAANETNSSCVGADASGLNPQNCPTSEDLSTPTSQMTAFASTGNGFGNYTNPNNGTSLKNQNLQVFNPNNGALIGCAAPYKKLTNPVNWNGLNIGANSFGFGVANYNEVIMYSCAYGSQNLIAGTGYVSPTGVPTTPPASTDSNGQPEGQTYTNIRNYCNSVNGPCVTTNQNPGGAAATDTFAAGPIKHTEYVKYVHNNSTNVYAWQYDDGIGTRVCNSNQTKITFVLCP